MICPRCAAAGDITAAVRRDQTTNPRADATIVRARYTLRLNRAADLHRACNGCTCQHEPSTGTTP